MIRLLWGLCAVVLLTAASARAQTDFVAFESGPVRPLALSPDGLSLFAVNTPDNRLEVFDVSAGILLRAASIPVGMEPVAVAARSSTEVWVVNHLSDSVSIIDLSSSPPQVVRTLLVGDEPRDIVFAGPGGNRAFITTAHRGQHRTDASISGVTGAGDPQLTTASTTGAPIGRADVWVFDASSLGTTIGGTPLEIVSFFADTPRALAVDRRRNADCVATDDPYDCCTGTVAGTCAETVYVAAFHSGNQTTVIPENLVPNGFGPNGVLGPSNNDPNLPVGGGVQAPETGIIVKWDGAAWRDAVGRDGTAGVNLRLPDHDVFALDPNTLAPGPVFDHVGTILFNMVVHPTSGKIFVTNTELPNHVRFEGPGNHGGSTVQGHLSEARITVIDPGTLSVDPRHLNRHIDYTRLHTDVPDIVDSNQILHSLATPLQPVVSEDGNTIYMAAFGSAKIGVFPTASIDDPNFATNFDPTTASANYISTAGGPSGLVLDELNDQLYVLTRFDNSVAVIDLTTKATIDTFALHNPEPTSVVEGRPFLYDAVATSGNGEASCSSCHIFGDLDSLAWNLGDPDAPTSINNQPSATILPPATTFHPMKGPMTTQTLRGMATHGGLHWRGDRVDGHFGTDPCTEPTGAPCDEDLSFRNFIVAFEGLVGMDGTISDPDMQKFADFTLQLMLPPNPVAELDNSLTASQQEGSDVFEGPTTDSVATCEGCHRLDPAQGFFGSGGGQSFEGEPQNAKVPHMRNLYAKIGMFNQSGSPPPDQVRGFGMLHDGSIDTVKSFLEAPVFSTNNAQELVLEQFALAFPGDLAPIVGQQVTLTSTNSSVVNPRIDLMIQRANSAFTSFMLGGLVTECDLVVKGSVGAVGRGWMHQSGTTFSDDLGNTISDAALRALAATEGPLTYTCAPPGSGTRMGVDRDRDVLLDGVETNTGAFVSASDTGTDPANADTDGDGFNDGVEVSAGSNPNDPLSLPSSTIPLLPSGGEALLIGLLLGAGVLALRRTRHQRTMST